MNLIDGDKSDEALVTMTRLNESVSWHKHGGSAVPDEATDPLCQCERRMGIARRGTGTLARGTR